MSIQSRSPHLFGMLRRRFERDALSQLDRCFAIALENGGEKELDYNRPEGMSFNPRLARVPLIVLEASSDSDLDTLAAAILAATDPQPSAEALVMQLTKGNIFSATHAARIIELANDASFFLTDPQRATEGKTLASYQIAAALLLDRARHLHLADGLAGKKQYQEFTAQLAIHLSTLENTAPSIYTLLRAWKNRAEQKIARNSPVDRRDLDPSQHCDGREATAKI